MQPGEGKKGSENNFRQEIYHSGQEEACPDSLRAVNCFCHWISSIASKCCPADILKETGQRPFSQSFSQYPDDIRNHLHLWLNLKFYLTDLPKTSSHLEEV